MPNDIADTPSASVRRSPPPPRTEEEFLALEEERALAAIAATGERFVEDLASCPPLARAIREHPVVTAVVAAVGGAATGKLLLQAARFALRTRLVRLPRSKGAGASRLAALLVR